MASEILLFEIVFLVVIKTCISIGGTNTYSPNGHNTALKLLSVLCTLGLMNVRICPGNMFIGTLGLINVRVSSWEYVLTSQAGKRKYHITKFLKVWGQKLLQGKGILNQETECNQHSLPTLQTCTYQQACVEATDGAFFNKCDILNLSLKVRHFENYWGKVPEVFWVPAERKEIRW